MNYYKPTTFLQKISKLLQLFGYLFRVQRLHRRRPVKSKHPGVLMVVSKLDRIGGVEFQALELSSALIHQGCLVIILTDRIDSSPKLEFRRGYLIRRLPKSTNTLAVTISLFLWMFRKRNSYQVVHVHGITGFTLLTLFLANFFGHRTLLKGATQDDFGKIFHQTNWKHVLYRKWILNADSFISISQRMKEEMIACGIPEEKIRPIPNAVNTRKFYPLSNDRRNLLRKKFCLSPDQNLFLYLGRLEARKGVDVLLRAWQKCSPGILWIVGAGPDAQRLERLQSELGLKSVVFHGETRSTPEYYQIADAFVFPSLKEGSPGVILEAMSCGIPCIATNIGGIVDLMQNFKEGLIVEPGDVDGLAEAIGCAASKTEDRIRWGQQARENVLQHFDLSDVARRYHSVYKEIL